MLNTLYGLLALAFGLTSVSFADSPVGAIIQEPDPLLSRMEGEWLGRGFRVFSQGKKKVLLEVQVRSSVDQAGVLLSRNRVLESPSMPGAFSTEAKEYERLYWVKFKRAGEFENAPRFYALGYGAIDAGERPSAEGVFAQNIFSVLQRVGGGFRVESRTEFFPDGGSVYSEKAWNGEELLAETEIQYQRVR
jgi:hypothetical protein